MSSMSPPAPERSQLLAASLSLLREPERGLLKRCALLASFDDGITSELSRDIGSGEGATLANLAKYPFVLEVRGRPGRYRIRDDMRRALLDSWWEEQPPDTVPPDLSTLSAHLAGLLERATDTDPAEVVGLRLFVDPLDALEQWKSLYAKADRRFDLVRCRSLIGMLSPMAAVRPEVDGVREDYETYAESRSLWMDEWYRTGLFLLPAASYEALESLIRGDRGRMLELRGFGGYGKTMHVRWLIARRCVLADARIPCARIDFDVIDPIAATRDPYLVLLEMADQLDRQLPGDAFGKLVRTYSADRVRLYRRSRATTARVRDARDPADEETRMAAAEEVLRRFGGRLAEIPADRPVVLILDTLEVPLHLPDTPRGPAVRPLLTALAAVQQAPSVRLILSGRYEIPEDIRELFPGRCERFELPKFSPAEARTYLVEKRHVERGDLVAAALRASERVPFSLALLADLIDEDPTVSPDKIAEYRGAEYAYLIEKVVKRIKEQPVRWVLRYAAIPRRFDYDFVRDVLWPRVREEMSGTGGRDHPAGDDLPQERDGQDVWAVGERLAREQTVQQVWNQVRRYASGSSWISPDEADADALRLQTEVVRPLRELLRGQEIFSVLHADAAEYFLRRAAEEALRGTESAPGEIPRDRRGEFLREAVFHRFRFEGEAAGCWWEEQIREADGPVARLALAGELARQPDYTDREGRPVPWGEDGMLVSEQTLLQARLELCIASAELATLLAPLRPQHALWQDASDALERLESFPTDALPSGRVALVRAAVALGTGQPEDTIENLRTALGSPDPSPRERLWLAALDAYLLIDAGSAEADARLRIAKRLEQDAMEARDVRQLLAFGLARRLRDRGALDEAIAECVAAIDEALGDADNFRLAEAELRLAAGDAERARSVAARVVADGSALSPLAQVLEGRCWRRQHRFGAAAAGARRLLTALEENKEVSPFATWVRARALHESGETAAALLHVGDARTAYADAIRLFGEAGDFEAAAGCHLQEATLLMNGLGHLRAAGVALDYADRAAPASGDVALLSQLTRAELAHRLGDHTEAAAILDRAGSADPRAALPARMAATAMAGLAFGKRRDRDRYATQLGEGLRQINPPAARLQLLTRAVRCPALKPQSEAVKWLRETVIPRGGWDGELAGLAVPDRTTLRLRAAAFARVLGDHDEACEMLSSALREIRDDEEPLAGLLEALRLARQLRSADLVADAGRASMASAQNQADECPLLAAVTVIEHLEAVMETRAELREDPAAACRRAEEWLKRGGSSAEGWWARLAKLYATIGNTDSATESSYLQTAVRLYSAAGDVQAAEEVQNRVAEPGARLAFSKPTITIELRVSRDAIKTKVAGRRTRLPPRRQGMISGPLRQTIDRWIRAAGPDPYPAELPDLMVAQWPDFKRSLAELLDVAKETTRLKLLAEQPDLVIRIYDGALQPLPWELAAGGKQYAPLFADFRRAYRQPALAAPDTRLVRVVQAGLNLLLGSSLEVDGVSGPDTARALRALTQDPGTPPVRADDPVTVQHLHQALLQGARPGVIIARAAPSQGRRPSFTLERRYAQTGFDPHTVDQAHIPALTRLLRAETPPVIVHIVGGLVATVGATAVDLQDDAWGWGAPDETGVLTSADLDHALRAVPRDWPAPVVVLDVPAPTGHREVADQLLLRNCFAADLFAMGGTRAVVGTGLASRAAADVVQDVLLEGLARGEAIGDVIQVMRQQAPLSGFGRFDSSAAFAATALWCTDPSMRLPALGGQ